MQVTLHFTCGLGFVCVCVWLCVCDCVRVGVCVRVWLCVWVFMQLVVRVEMNNGSSKTLMVDERQTVRDVLDNLFEKTHCDCNIDWCLCETSPDLQTGRTGKRHTHTHTRAHMLSHTHTDAHTHTHTATVP